MNDHTKWSFSSAIQHSHRKVSTSRSVFCQWYHSEITLTFSNIAMEIWRYHGNVQDRKCWKRRFNYRILVSWIQRMSWRVVCGSYAGGKEIVKNVLLRKCSRPLRLFCLCKGQYNEICGAKFIFFSVSVATRSNHSWMRLMSLGIHPVIWSQDRVGNLRHHWLRWWPGADQPSSHCLIQCWNIVNWALRNKFQWNCNQNSTIFIDEIDFENVV